MVDRVDRHKWQKIEEKGGQKYSRKTRQLPTTFVLLEYLSMSNIINGEQTFFYQNSTLWRALSHQSSSNHCPISLGCTLLITDREYYRKNTHKRSQLLKGKLER